MEGVKGGRKEKDKNKKGGWGRERGEGRGGEGRGGEGRGGEGRGGEGRGGEGRGGEGRREGGREGGREGLINYSPTLSTRVSITCARGSGGFVFMVVSTSL